jgi:hypothetical protein
MRKTGGTMNPEYEAQIEKLAEWQQKQSEFSSLEWEKLSNSSQEHYRNKARQLLADMKGDKIGLAVVKWEAEVPKRAGCVCANCWITTQNDMLNAGFVKEVKADE